MLRRGFGTGTVTDAANGSVDNDSTSKKVSLCIVDDLLSCLPAVISLQDCKVTFVTHCHLKDISRESQRPIISLVRAHMMI